MTSRLVATALSRARVFCGRARGPAPVGALDLLRARGVVVIAFLGWATLAMLLVAGLWVDNGSPGALLGVGALVNMAPTAMALQGRFDAQARIIVGTLAAAMPALLVFLLRDHAWQMDGHMYFFVALAMLTMLCDWRPIAVASGLIAAHHLAFEFLAPAWVFTGAGNLGRIVFHAVAVVMQFGVLSYITLRLGVMIQRQDAAVAESRRLVAVAETERARTADALDAVRAAEQDAAAERRRRGVIEKRLAAERDAELRVLASEFERSVSTVVKSIEDAGVRLAGSSTYLSDIAGDAGREAGDVASSAADATDQIRLVADSLRNLSASVSTIAVTAQQQDASTREAHGEGRASVEMIAHLLQQAGQVSAFVDVIRRIASKTNMLALNATIEAARAGEAGRGFAVVAGEVKNLAGDAARASDEIASLLQNIRGAIAEAAAGVGSVTVSVEEVAHGASGIAAAVESQRSYAARIEDSASRAASSAQAIGHRIGRVASAVSAASVLSIEVHKSAGALSADAGALRVSTDRFVSFLRDG